MLRDHLQVGEHRHEVRVSGPARHDVEMDVVGDARPRDATEVPAEVEPFRAVGASENVDGRNGEPVDLERLVVGEFAEGTDVAACGATMTWPDEYGNLFRSAIAASPSCTRSDSSCASVPAASAQKTHPACSSACAMYSSRHGAHRGFVMARFYQCLRRVPEPS
jgi:hypothetical protein